MVTGEVPTGVPTVVVIVRAEVTALAPGVTEFGTNAQVAPVGRPEQERLTALVKPFDGVTVTVDVAEDPGAIEAGERAEAETVKLATAPAGCRKATACMTQPVFTSCVAVASHVPAAWEKECSISLPNLLRITVAKPLPATVTTPVTSAAPRQRSPVLVVVTALLSRPVPAPACPPPASRGLAVSRPLYSAILTSGVLAA